jgi:hypothetical protein
VEKTLRKLNSSFVKHQHLLTSWPRGGSTATWLREVAEIPVSSGVYTAMKKGQPVPEKFLLGWCRMLKEKPGLEMESIRRSVGRYLGVSDWTSVSIDDLVNQLVSPPLDLKRYFGLRKDFMAAGGVFDRIFRSRSNVARAARLCQTPEHIEQMISWMYITAGREIGDENISPDEAIAISNKRIKLSVNEFASRTLQWQRYDPWTIVVAKEDDASIAMCLILPVSQETYHSVRQGELCPEEISTDQLQAPTNHVIVEGIAIRPNEDGMPRMNPTLAIMRLGISQVGAFVFPRGYKPGTIRILTFGGTPRSEVRLKAQGYKPVHKSTAKTKAPMFEQVLPRSFRYDKVFPRTVLWMTGRRISSPPLP